MNKKRVPDQREIYKSIRKEPAPPTRTIPDKRDELKREQFESDLEEGYGVAASKSKVRVRFAPSPTGLLHIGGARTALYNWLFSKKNKGSLVLRIEDTDRVRSTQEATQTILESLSWLGLEWDEGPFHQIDRLPLYREAAEKLIKENKAYYCYCRADEYGERRQKAIAEGRMPHYDRRCLSLTEEERKSLIDEGRKPSVRFLTPDTGRTVAKDLIRGNVIFENSQFGDFIMVRSDNTPTYNLAAAVDDGLMEITHIIRGEDHLPNTPKQILLYEALGYEQPLFAHLPMILGADKTPLSKRHGATSVGEFEKEGYLPEALLNYIALLGWSYDDATTLFSIEELVERFSLDKVSKSSAVFDIEKLDWMNGTYIRNAHVKELTQKCLAFLVEAGLLRDMHIEGKELEKLEQMIALAQERIKRLSEIAPAIAGFFEDEVVYEEDAVQKVLGCEEAGRTLSAARRALNDTQSWKHDEIEKDLRTLQQELEIKPRIVFQAIRVAVTGKTVSLPLFETLELLGRAKVLERLDKAVHMHS